MAVLITIFCERYWAILVLNFKYLSIFSAPEVHCIILSWDFLKLWMQIICLNIWPSTEELLSYGCLYFQGQSTFN